MKLKCSTLQLSILFHTSLLFTCTSFGHIQGAQIETGLEKEIQQHINAILHFAEKMITQSRRNGPLFLTFPLFLSGAVTSSHSDKMIALKLLEKLGRTDLGYNAAATSSMLRIVCETQLQHSRSGGSVREIDWSEVAANHGFRLVNYG